MHVVLSFPPLTRPARAGLLALLLLAVGLRPAPAQASDYDATVIAVGASPTPTHVAVGYSHPVKHEALRAAMAGLAREVGRPVEDLVLEDAPLYPGSQTTSTAAEFTSPGLVTPGTVLPVAAIVRALPEWRHLRISFLTGGGFRFTGPGDGAVLEGCRVRLFASASSYEYDVERTPVGTAPPAVAAPPGTQPLPAPREARPLAGGIVALVVILSLAAVVAACVRARSPRRLK